MARMTHIIRWLVGVLLLSAGMWLFPRVAQGAITIDLVPVGDSGNVGELSGEGSGGVGPPRVCGAVPYVYQIGKHEVTNTEYRSFLNSVARYADPYTLYLYDPRGPQLYQGIARTGSGTALDPYVYLARDNDPNWDNKPVNYVSWYSSLRFINWLQNGQPTAEAGPGVTETGTYTFSDPSTVTIPDHATLTAPTWVLPTEDEWYKSAYYKGGGTTPGYWDYATQSDTLPNNNPPSLDTGNSANYYLLDSDPNTPGYAVGPPYYMTDAGAYTVSESAYGTYDQNGNLWELLEDPSPYGLPGRGIRGGEWGYYQGGLPAYARGFSAGPDQVVGSGGFRIALVPEPGAAVLLLIVSGTGSLRRRR